jgi:hypothetical protein
MATERENRRSLVDIINYDYYWPHPASKGAVYGFTHSREVLDICSGMLSPQVVTPVDKSVLREALTGYLQRRGISHHDAARILAWLEAMPEEIAIIEREP